MTNEDSVANPQDIGGLCICLNEAPKEVPEVGKGVTVKIKGADIKGQIRWVAGVRTPDGELIKKEFDAHGHVVERVLGHGSLEDYFGADVGDAVYIIGVKCYSSVH